MHTHMRARTHAHTHTRTLYFAQLWHINSCLAYTKGLARWVGIWDLDEFMVPLRKGKNIMEVRACVRELGYVYVCS